MAEDRDDFIIRSIREDREIREALNEERPLQKQVGEIIIRIVRYNLSNISVLTS